MLKSLHNPQEIRSYLKKRPARHLYELGDLGPFFWPYTQWWGWQTQAEIQALLLLYASEHGPSLLAFSEDNTAQLHLIQAAHAFLPARFHLQTTSRAEQLKTLYTLKAAEPHFRLKLKQNDFKPLSGHFQTKVLTASDLPQIKALYQEAYPINWFEKRMLDTEMYLGTFISGKLIAIAGVHLYSPSEGFAALGNIATHPKYRGQKHSQILCSQLCQRLFEKVDLIGLNVLQDNHAALKTYRNLGFSHELDFTTYQAELKI